MQKENRGSYDVNKGPLGVFWGTSDQHFAPEYLVRYYIFLMYTCLPLLQRNLRHGSHGVSLRPDGGDNHMPLFS